MTSTHNFERLRREAKSWLKALKGRDDRAELRLRRALHPTRRSSGSVTLRTVQLALAREHGYAGWTELKAALEPHGVEARDLDRRFVESSLLHFGVKPGDDRFSDYEDHPVRRSVAASWLESTPALAERTFLGAVVAGNVDAVERHLAADPELVHDRGGPHGNEPLLLLARARLPTDAATSNAVRIAALLLDHGANPNATWTHDAGDRHREIRPLDALMGHRFLGPSAQPAHPLGLEFAELLLQRGASPLAIEGLHALTAGPDDDRWLRLLIRYGLGSEARVPWLNPDNAGLFEYLLGYAGSLNHPRLASALLEHGADPSSTWVVCTWDRMTQYQNAAAKNSTEVAELLVRHGAARDDLCAFDRFMAAVLSDDEDLYERLFRDTDEFRTNAGILMVFEAASERDRVRLARRLLRLGTPVDFEVDDGFRALHRAAASNATGVLQLLVDRGAEVDARDKRYHQTPLGWALHHAAVDSPAILAERSRDVFALAKGGFVERLAALARTEPEVLCARAPFHIATGGELIEEGATALFSLPIDEARALEVADCLLAAGVDREARDAQGRTAAEFAAERDQRATARLLTRNARRR